MIFQVIIQFPHWPQMLGEPPVHWPHYPNISANLSSCLFQINQIK